MTASSFSLFFFPEETWTMTRRDMKEISARPLKGNAAKAWSTSYSPSGGDFESPFLRVKIDTVRRRRRMRRGKKKIMMLLLIFLASAIWLHLPVKAGQIPPGLQHHEWSIRRFKFGLKKWSSLLRHGTYGLVCIFLKDWRGQWRWRRDTSEINIQFIFRTRTSLETSHALLPV